MNRWHMGTLLISNIYAKKKKELFDFSTSPPRTHLQEISQILENGYLEMPIVSLHRACNIENPNKETVAFGPLSDY